MTNTLQGIYDSAASVQSKTGVDPAIITAMAQTEGPTGANASLISAGIQLAASSGRGTSGATLPGATSQPGQPSAFWAYDSGAEMSQAFANYIAQQFPNEAQYLGNASQFFQSMEGTNYDVVYNNPAVGASSGINWTAIANYWKQKITAAEGFASQFGNGSDGTTQPPQGTTDTTGGGTTDTGSQGSAVDASASMVSSESAAGQMTAPTVLGSAALGTIASRLSSKGFWWSVGFFLLAGVLILVGLLVYFRKQVEQAVVNVGKTAATAAEVAA